MIESAELNYTYSETAQIHPNTHTHKSVQCTRQQQQDSKSSCIVNQEQFCYNSFTL